MKILSLINYPHIIQNSKTFFHLQNTNWDILYEILSDLYKQQHNWPIQGPER